MLTIEPCELRASRYLWQLNLFGTVQLLCRTSISFRNQILVIIIDLDLRYAIITSSTPGHLVRSKRNNVVSYKSWEALVIDALARLLVSPDFWKNSLSWRLPTAHWRSSSFFMKSYSVQRGKEQPGLCLKLNLLKERQATSRFYFPKYCIMDVMWCEEWFLGAPKSRQKPYKDLVQGMGRDSNGLWWKIDMLMDLLDKMNRKKKFSYFNICFLQDLS